MMNALRKLVALALVLVSFVPAAFAQSTTSFSFEGSLSLLDEHDLLKARDEETWLYYLMDKDGNALTEPLYSSLYDYDAGLLEAVDAEGMMGVINASGESLVPCAYEDVEILSDRWQIGVKLEPATAENYDYSSFTGDNYYLVSRYDVYYQGALIGALERMEYSYAEAYGAYLCVKERDEDCMSYDATFTARPIENIYDEFSYDYSTEAYVHVPTGTPAFCAECTLTSEDVLKDITWDRGSGAFINLQGDVVFEPEQPVDYAYDFENGYAVIESQDYLLGVVDEQGRQVIPCEYDDISSYNLGEGLFAGGYQSVEKDGKIGFYRADGTLSCEPAYAENGSDYSTCFLVMTDLDGSVRVVTAERGLLDQAFAETEYLNNCSKFLPVMNDAGEWGLLDIYGNMALPFAAVESIKVSKNGVMALVEESYDHYTVYLLDEPVPSQEAATVGESGKDALSEGWTCAACGTNNTGKFCTECGAAKPVEAVSVCPNCGYDAGEETPNFCPECGAAMNAQ